MNRYTLIISLFLISFSFTSKAQTDITMQNCIKYLEPEFISDGQQYKALLSGSEIAEFHTTFYADNYYRIVAATGKEEKNVIFSIYDEENHLLFSNKDHQNSPYWDFQFTHSINCTIEAKLNQRKVTSGFVLLLIGFKQ